MAASTSTSSLRSGMCSSAHAITGRTHHARRGRLCGLPSRCHPQRGQAMTEYVVVIAAGIILLLAVVAGSNSSTVQQMIVALKNFWTNYSYLISLP